MVVFTIPTRISLRKIRIIRIMEIKFVMAFSLYYLSLLLICVWIG